MTTKRTMGQCSEECTRHRYASAMNGACGHLSTCPALYSLQPQPGDEKDALTRLTAHCRTAWLIGPNATNRLDADDWEAAALDLISEAREEQRTALLSESSIGTVAEVARSNAQDEVDRLTVELARAKELVTTLTLQQSEVRQQAFRAMAAEMADMDTDEQRNLHLCRILTDAKESAS